MMTSVCWMLPTARHLVLTPRRRAGRSSPVIAAPRSIGGGFEGVEAGDAHQLFATGQRGARRNQPATDAVQPGWST